MDSPFSPERVQKLWGLVEARQKLKIRPLSVKSSCPQPRTREMCVSAELLKMRPCAFRGSADDIRRESAQLPSSTQLDTIARVDGFLELSQGPFERMQPTPGSGVDDEVGSGCEVQERRVSAGFDLGSVLLTVRMAASRFNSDGAGYRATSFVMFLTCWQTRSIKRCDQKRCEPETEANV